MAEGEEWCEWELIKAKVKQEINVRSKTHEVGVIGYSIKDHI